jgi:hypothetical protein
MHQLGVCKDLGLCLLAATWAEKKTFAVCLYHRASML